MNEQVKEYIEKYPEDIITLFCSIREILMENLPIIYEKMWAKLPSYYVGDSFVRLIPFKDHINLEATAINQHREELSGYKITPKGMLQLYVKQEIPCEALKQIFSETLISKESRNE